MDKTDKKILDLLSQNVRIPISQIGREVGLTENAIKYRIKRLEDDFYIKKYTLLLNPDRFGKNLMSMFFINATPEKLSEVVIKLKEAAQLTNVYVTTGHYPIFALGYFQDNQELNDFVKNKLSDIKIREVEIMTVLEKAKDGIYEKNFNTVDVFSAKQPERMI